MTQEVSVLHMADLPPAEIVRSNRKTLALEVTEDGRVLIRAPLKMSVTRIRTFAESHRSWLERALSRQRERIAAEPPPLSKDEVAALHERAMRELPHKVDYYSKLMGLTPTGIRITNARTRYGSCSSKNRLCFSCFLMNCPEEAIDLVVVHELAHIQEKNHGPKFYALLSSVLPDYREREKLLSMPRRET